MRMSGRLFVVAAVGLALAGLCATGASADSPRVVHDRFTDELIRVDNTTCAFPIDVRSSADIDDALFLDDAGNVVRLLETVNHAVITFTANGKTLEARGSGGFAAQFDPHGSTSVSTFGIDLLLTLPGEGAILLDAGRAEFLFDPHIHVLFEAGPQQYDLAAFCAALAP